MVESKTILENSLKLCNESEFHLNLELKCIFSEFRDEGMAKDMSTGIIYSIHNYHMSINKMNRILTV